MNDCASAGENQIRGCSLSRAIGAITPQHSQHLIIFVKKSVAIPWTLEGAMTVSEGDYIIEGVQGEFYPCKPDIFRQTYDFI